jgi:hypothetical protein
LRAALQYWPQHAHRNERAVVCDAIGAPIDVPQFRQRDRRRMQFRRRVDGGGVVSLLASLNRSRRTLDGEQAEDDENQAEAELRQLDEQQRKADEEQQRKDDEEAAQQRQQQQQHWRALFRNDPESLWPLLDVDRLLALLPPMLTLSTDPNLDLARLPYEMFVVFANFLL